MNIAVIGGGIAGLSCAHALARSGRGHVSLIEAAPVLGGHTHTVDVTLDGVTHPVDTGFLVFNHRTYPLLTNMFAELGVATAKSEMSFAVSLAGRIEWAGTSLATVFAQPQNLLRPRFLRMLADILRFNRAATAAATAGAIDAEGPSLGRFIQEGRYSAAFRDWYLLPMAGAIWSCPTRTMLDYPFATFARFCHNHGLLQVADRPQWHTVVGGGREYVRRLARDLPDIRLSSPVESVRRTPAGVLVTAAGVTERYDHAVLACHSDQALAMLEAPGADEQAMLGAVGYQPNVAWLHTDTTLMPRRKRVWAAWNYLSDEGAGATPDSRPLAVSYLINRLQPLPFRTPVIVTLNPAAPPAAEHLIRRIDYAHPVFDAAAIAAQRQLPSLQGRGGIWFAGAWTGYGFHEDGLASGLAVAAAIGEGIALKAAA